MTNPPPSNTRRVVLFFAVTLAIITYVDRVCISQAAPAMQEELGLTKSRWVMLSPRLAGRMPCLKSPGDGSVIASGRARC